MEGKFLSYYENGNLKQVANYLGDVVHGSLEMYFESGKKQSKSYFNNGLQDSLTEYWYESGMKESEAWFNNGVIDGEFKEYYENGELKMQAIYERDTVIFYKEYTIDGILEKEFRFLEIIQNKDTLALEEDLEIHLKLAGPKINSKHIVRLIVHKLFDENVEETVQELNLQMDENGEIIHTLTLPHKIGEYMCTVGIGYENFPRSKAWFNTDMYFWILDNQ
jgi:hypothetical protein